MSKVKRLVFDRFGPPSEVLRLEDAPDGGSSSGPYRVRMLAAPVNPADFGRIGGTYGSLPELPAVGGMEGVGVIESGPESGRLRPGVRVALLGSTWQTFRSATAEELVIAPAALDPVQAAMVLVNPPTAWLLLHDIVDLRPGDWVLQNAATSAVGVLVSRIARSRGFRVIHAVRDVERGRDRLNSAEHVFADDDELPAKVRDLTRGEGVRLALNSIGGASAIRQIKSLVDGGTQVTFGGMTGEAVRFPTRYLIFNRIKLRGFWMQQWWRTADENKRRRLTDEIFRLYEAGILRVPVDAVYGLEEHAAALERAGGGGRSGKVLFVMDDALRKPR